MQKDTFLGENHTVRMASLPLGGVGGGLLTYKR